MIFNVLTIRSRQDRIKNIKERHKSFPEVELKFYFGRTSSNRKIDLFDNFKQVIADNLHKPYTIIIEDDNLYTENFSIKYLQSIIQQGLEIQADVIIGGVDRANPIEITSQPNLLSCINYQGSQFLIVYKNFYEKVMNVRSNDFYEFFISKHSTCKRFITFPFISYQDNTPSNFGRTNVTENFINKEKQIKQWYQTLHYKTELMP